MNADLVERARRVRLLLFDVDGVLTDGKILLHADGTESKQFDIRDGTAIVLAQRAGLTTGLLSARQSAATTERAPPPRIPIVRQGAGEQLEALGEILAGEGLAEHQVAYMGDDLLDLPVLGRVGLAAAPADAAAEVIARAHWVSTAPGGRGAVREFIEMILRAQNRWDNVLREYVRVDS